MLVIASEVTWPLTFAGAAATTIGGCVLWFVTSRKKDLHQGEGFLADATHAVTDAAMNLMDRYMADNALLRGELAAQEAECDQRIKDLGLRCDRQLEALRDEVIRLGGDPSILHSL